MSDVTESLLLSLDEKPFTCFDKYLLEHKSDLKKLDKEQLNFLLSARENCKKAAGAIKMTREELFLCFAEGTVDPDGMFAQVCNDFLIADSFFE